MSVFCFKLDYIWHPEDIEENHERIHALPTVPMCCIYCYLISYCWPVLIFVMISDWNKCCGINITINAVACFV
jgi:hypothetical protein